MAKLHDAAVERAKSEAQQAGLRPCATNQQLGSRRPDLKCGSAYIEVKTFDDLRTDHTKQQLGDMRKEADRSGSLAIVYVAEGECYSGINELGQVLVQRQGLRMCRCAVPKSDITELTDCLGKRAQTSHAHKSN